MTAIEPRYPCPVCLGTQLRKTRLADDRSELVLDSCGRCGGIWFELGEVQRLRQRTQQDLWQRVPRRAEIFRMICHDCHASLDRNAEECPACGWRNTIACPSCDRPLSAELHDGLRLDVCKRCRGVWFDHVELAAIWTLTVAASRGTVTRGSAAQDAPFMVAEVLMYSPDLLIYGAHSAGMAIEGGASALANAPEAVIAIAEGAGDVAASAFEAVMNILAELF